MDNGIPKEIWILKISKLDGYCLLTVRGFKVGARILIFNNRLYTIPRTELSNGNHNFRIKSLDRKYIWVRKGESIESIDNIQISKIDRMHNENGIREFSSFPNRR